MSPRGEVCVCESCHLPGVLALFRSPHPIETGWNPVAMCPTYTHAIVLCIGCAERSGFPRFLNSASIAAAVGA